LQREGKYTDAAIVIEKALLLDPSNSYFKGLRSLNEKGTTIQVDRDVDTNRQTENLVNLGIKEYVQGNYDKAKEYFVKVLDISPGDLKAKNSISKIDAKIAALGAGYHAAE